MVTFYYPLSTAELAASRIRSDIHAASAAVAAAAASVLKFTEDVRTTNKLYGPVERPNLQL